jgi:hypothetical protein
MLRDFTRDELSLPPVSSNPIESESTMVNTEDFMTPYTTPVKNQFMTPQSINMPHPQFVSPELKTGFLMD